MTTPWQPYRESLRATIIRNMLIALVGGAVIAGSTAHSLRPIHWPIAVVLMLWPSFGGHWLEVWYLNWLRPRVPAARAAQVAARFVTWFAGGCVLGIGMALTAGAIYGDWSLHHPVWWVAGTAFIGVELVAHMALQARGTASFYNGRG